jgi:amphiphysin
MAVILSPIAGEYDLIGKHPNSAHTIRSVTNYEQAMIEMKEVVSPELQLIESRIMGPAKELQLVMKVIRKTITKREHKVYVICGRSLCAID